MAPAVVIVQLVPVMPVVLQGISRTTDKIFCKSSIHREITLPGQYETGYVHAHNHTKQQT